MTTELLYEHEVDPSSKASAATKFLGFTGDDTPENWGVFVATFSHDRGEELAARALKVRDEKERDRNLVGHALALSTESHVLLVSNDDSMLALARGFQEHLAAVEARDRTMFVPLESIVFSRSLYRCGAYTLDEMEACLASEYAYTLEREDTLKHKKFKRKIASLERVARELNLPLVEPGEIEDPMVSDQDLWDFFLKMDGS